VKPTPPTARVVFGAVSLAIVLFGIGAISHDLLLSYRNWWGGIIFGPFAIIVGALFFVVLVIHPEKVSANKNRRSRRRF
jgi:hypothetical protein